MISKHGYALRLETLFRIDDDITVSADRFQYDYHSALEERLSYHDETHSKVIVPIALNNAFYSWVFAQGKKIRITAPEEAVEGMKKLLADVASRYEDK